MTLKDDLETEVKKIFRDQWDYRDGTVVPTDETVGLGNKGVRLDATVLYADLSESTNMVDTQKPYFSAEVYKTFLHCCAKIIKSKGGVITAYDGDRIMAVYVGDYKNTNATKSALMINWANKFIIQPALDAQYSGTQFKIKHTVGIDTSKLLVAKTGVRGANDLVWVGRAANWAAKLTTLSHDTPTWITKAVYDKLAPEAKSTNGTNMWEHRLWTKMNNADIYRSSWRWSFS
ncbi:adenylate/guanylate cyclase domain-containing protein [Brucella intermedia]|uniref:adenylate/guanylate cyclase domain-containing protein n=1 Tax=Brucella intermedia TaxID=94625 RepID=UPI00165D0887|nr:adenylate/guanylate cyclase domain-containing protein [Brucella intermedia]QNQ40042.1 adenylate/guanylate cyclase domain-containing protein [Brucella intermedia]